MSYHIVPFTKALSRSDFDCGKAPLNDWLQQQAGQQERRGNTRTFLAHEDGRALVVGYYASSATALTENDQSIEIGLRPGKYPRPAIRIVRLAVDKKHQGLGLGEMLVVHALSSVVQVAEKVGIEFVIVDALDLDAAAFYGRLGFSRLEDSPLRLVITVKEVPRLAW
jgi:ribosomal protein S18 acetylase RimI-like enzyme